MQVLKLNSLTTGLFLLLAVQGGLYGQNVRYTCYKKTVCMPEPVQLKKFNLTSGSTMFVSNDSGVCYIPLLGTYRFHSEEIVTGTEFTEVRFTRFEKRSDTLQEPSLYPPILHGETSQLKNGDWLYCGAKAEGYRVDYYANGQKRVEGTFKNGRPRGNISFYNEAGTLTNTEFYNRRGRKVRELKTKHG